MRMTDISRIPLGTFIRPPAETLTGQPRVEAVYGYAVRHDRGVVLLDTGIGQGDPETEAWYRPQRVSVQEALHTKGFSVEDVTMVVNCHLHFDHCGANPMFAGIPLFCQRRELLMARTGDYTVAALIDFPGARYELLGGEAEILPGVHVVPTPGHVEGHQSLVVVCDDGSIVLAGQSHDTASAWSADALAGSARDLGHVDPLPSAPGWMARLLEFDPKRVMFAHDGAVWEP
jgi:N-acyl homoserine lactone hydrolase